MTMQKKMLKTAAAACAAALAAVLLAGCGDRQSTAEDIATPEDTQTDRIVVGFSQVGAESDWRSANTESMKSTFTKEAGYDLIFEDGQQKQANQIRAIRTFIQQEVDYIVLAPVTETGWDTVLREAKDAGIPVVIVDYLQILAAPEGKGSLTDKQAVDERRI